MVSGGPRKGAGRKPLPKKQKRSIAVQVRLTAVEKKRLDARVRELGTTCGSYLYMLSTASGTHWTKTPPTQPGWYWGRDESKKKCLVEIYDGNGQLRSRVHEDSRAIDVPMRVFDLWAGPIEPPPLPEVER